MQVIVSDTTLLNLVAAGEQVLNITRGSEKWRDFYNATEQAVIEANRALKLPMLNRVPVNGH